MNLKELPALVRVFAYLSLLTVGGGMAAFPELKVLTVDVHHWLTFPQLIHLRSNQPQILRDKRQIPKHLFQPLK